MNEPSGVRAGLKALQSVRRCAEATTIRRARTRQVVWDTTDVPIGWSNGRSTWAGALPGFVAVRTEH
jgi:hypothetical protein